MPGCGEGREHRTAAVVRWPVAVAAAGLLGLLVTAGGAAQTVRGRLLDAASDEAIQGARVTLLLALDGRRLQQVVTDKQGAFALQAPVPGRYRLRAERIGYTATTGPALDLAPGETLKIEFRLAAAAVSLAPVTVVGRAGRQVIDPYLERKGYYDRDAIYGRRGIGFGYFLDGDKLNPAAFDPSDLVLGAPGVWLTGMGGTQTILTGRLGCHMRVYLDGVLVRGDLDEWITTQEIVAVEVYPDPMLGSLRYGGCAAVFWTGIRR